MWSIFLGGSAQNQNWHAHAAWRSFFLCFSCSVALPILTFSTPLRPECLFCSWADKLALPCCAAFVLFAFLMLGGVAFFCVFNPCASRMFTLVMGCPTGAPMLCGVYLFVSHARWFCRFGLFNPSMALKLVNLILL